jgi:DNA-binding MarR family transcriptional regulator
MRSEVLESITEDLLSIPPLIFRGVRRKLLKTALANGEVDITPLQFEIMRLLEEVGTLHIAEIGDKLQIARPQMTHLIDKLEDLGMVERQMGTADRRMINIVLTGQGKNTLKQHDSRIRNAIRETLSCLTDDELEDLSDSLRKTRDVLSKLQ